MAKLSYESSATTQLCILLRNQKMPSCLSLLKTRLLNKITKAPFLEHKLGSTHKEVPVKPKCPKANLEKALVEPLLVR